MTLKLETGQVEGLLAIKRSFERGQGNIDHTRGLIESIASTEVGEGEQGVRDFFETHFNAES